jgi:hypothetical protein
LLVVVAVSQPVAVRLVAPVGSWRHPVAIGAVSILCIRPFPPARRRRKAVRHLPVGASLLCLSPLLVFEGAITVTFGGCSRRPQLMLAVVAHRVHGRGRLALWPIVSFAVCLLLGSVVKPSGSKPQSSAMSARKHG